MIIIEKWLLFINPFQENSKRCICVKLMKQMMKYLIFFNGLIIKHMTYWVQIHQLSHSLQI